MKIISWNINGLRAYIKHNSVRFFEKADADVICLQETKGMADFELSGFHAYWNAAKRPGYSGTLTLSRIEPLSVRYGFDVEKFDDEGRLVTLEYPGFFLVNAYFPNSQHSLDRLEYRLEWDSELLFYLRQLPKPVILCGDINVARDYIDIYPENLRNEESPPGFRSEEREGFEALLEAGFVDVFRNWYPKRTGAYTWWSNRLNKRLENRGWRLDYFLVTKDIVNDVCDIRHLTDVLGSDHCPIELTIRERAPQRITSQNELAQEWQEMDWERAERELLKYQQSISRLTYARNMSEVTEVQKVLVRSRWAKVLAVRHVVKEDSEPGIDGMKWTTDAEKMEAALSLTSKGYHAKPYRKIIINADGKERGINIPVCYDKAMQVLYAYSVDPVAESLGDRQSYAFRKGRSIFDAHSYIQRNFSGDRSPRFVVLADVRKCYDRISHDWLIRNIPLDKKVLAETLSAGSIYDGELFPPLEYGISQGASLSPILGNMTLDGLQGVVFDRLYGNGPIDYGNGSMVRFADDLIFTARSLESAQVIMEVIQEFLAVRGLELNWSKSSIVDIEEGFEFLSRWYQRKYHGALLVSEPSERAVDNFQARLQRYISGFKGSQLKLIDGLNRKLAGWGNYHRVTDAREAFRTIDSSVQTFLLEKVRELHPARQMGHLVNKYWVTDSQERHVFALPDTPTHSVIFLSDMNVAQHIPIKTGYQPYLDITYYEQLKRRRDNQKVSGVERKGIWTRQEGRCFYCERRMLMDQDITLVEVNPKAPNKSLKYAYVHTACAGFVQDEAEAEPIPILEKLEKVSEPISILKQPYDGLREYFRLCKKNIVVFRFKDIEKLLGEELPTEASTSETFWTDRASMETVGGTVSLDEPVHSNSPISFCWESQSYEIQHLDLEQRKVVFRRKHENTSGLELPKYLVERPLPDVAIREANEFFKHLKKKYGL